MKLKILILISTLFFTDANIKIIQYPISSNLRLQLTKEYSLMHYGINSYKLINPKIIVIHFTAIGSLKTSLKYFKPARVWSHRKYIKKFGSVNVGVHFVVSKKGSIYSLLPTDVIGRHAIGLNHLSIGIENVGLNEKDLTEAQVKSNAIIVQHLIKKHPSIEYLIGHYEYTNKNLSHYKLYLAKNSAYRPTIKIDPGKTFMKKLRIALKNKFNIILKK